MPKPSPWKTKPALETQLIAIWNSGKTARECAIILGRGITRNSVVAKIDRLRQSGIDLRSTAMVQVKPPKPVSPPRQKPTPPPTREVVIALEPITLADGSSVTVLNARLEHCRYPYGEAIDADFRYCGRHASKGSFCADHAVICYQPLHRPKPVEDEAA